MRVLKRSGDFEPVSFDKVLRRISALSDGLEVDVWDVAQKVCGRIYDGVKTSELDELAAQMCSSLIVVHPDYSQLASRIIVSNHHKNTPSSFSAAMRQLHGMQLVTDELMAVVDQHAEELDAAMDYARDYQYEYFGFKTLEKGYLARDVGGVNVIERPQHMLMRVAIGIYGDDVTHAIESYHLMSKRFYTHATPTLFNAGTRRPQLSSCFLVMMSEDSIDGIYNTLKDCASISKFSGGIGLHVHNVRARNSIIRGTNGQSTGIIPMLRVFNATARYVNQCFHPSTLVYTERGPLRIKDVRVGDRVVTHDGTVQLVTHVHENPVANKDMCVVKTAWSDRPIMVTPEHQVMTLKDGLKSAGELRAGEDQMMVPLHMSLAKRPTYDNYPVICKLVGMVLAHGQLVAPDRVELDPSCMAVADVNMVCEKDGACLLTPAALDLLRPYRRAGVGALLADRIMTLGPVSMEHVLTGMRAAAGRTLTVRDAQHAPLVKQLLSQRLGYTVHCASEIELRVAAEQRLDTAIYPVECVEHQTYTGYTYDLTVDKNHTYLTDMGIVHNSGKRNGSCAIFLEPWHPDVEAFLDLRKNHGNEEERARDLFLAMWIPDLFMRRVQQNAKWSLMCPDLCPGLSDCHGVAFDELYERYEQEGRYVKQVNAMDVWFKILESQIETGTPYMGYKDHANAKTNQSNIGIIKSSNLCMEIMEVSKPDEIAVCNLASVCLPSYVAADRSGFDFEALHSVVKVVTRSLNRVIDVNFYPVDKARHSNMMHRPIGIGVQGLADAFIMLRMPFESEAARDLNRLIFETMYHAALEASMELAREQGHPYSSFQGSPASKGVLQFDMWGVQPTPGRYDWDALKTNIQQFGLANSLLIAPMPTASTSQICGWNECFEPFTSNVYKRKTLAGEFILVNKHLVSDLMRLGLWDSTMRDRIVAAEGSVQGIAEIPSDIRELYKTVWEIKQRSVIDMAADRGAFICQSQSMNLFLESPDAKKLSAMHFYAWKKGLKTGMYYLRSKPRAKTQKFTLDPRLSKGNIDGPACTMEEGCAMCSA